MIKKTLVGNSEGNELFHCDTIEHKGALWLVPQWLHNQSEGWMQPARIVRMTGLNFQVLEAGSPYGDYTLNEPMPKSVLDGKTVYAGVKKYEVVSQPDIRFPTGGVQ